MKPRALFIDFDGTLADSMGILWEAFASFMESHSLPARREEFEELVGPTLLEAMELLKERYRLKEAAASLAALYQERLLAAYGKQVEPITGAKEALEHLSPHYLCVIVTAAIAPPVALFLQRHCLESHIAQIITAEGLARGKPDPALYQKALETLGLAPEEARAIEDSANGVAAATAANIPTFWLGGDPSASCPLVTPIPSWHTLLKRLLP